MQNGATSSIGVEVERKAFTKGDEDSMLGYVEVWRCLWDAQVRKRVMWQVQSSRDGLGYRLRNSATGGLGQHLH